MFDWVKGKWAQVTGRTHGIPNVQVNHLRSAPPARVAWNDGEKFPGGYGPTQLLITDYWTLRARSAELFETNLYARGLVRRLVTNEINTGLHLEATPDAALLGMDPDAAADWSESTEKRFQLWADNPKLCDHSERLTFGQLQAAARMEALVAGDVLVVTLQDPITSLPRIQLINGAHVQTPLGTRLNEKLPSGNRIVHGVELDDQGRHVAYWIAKPAKAGTAGTSTMQRLPAFGEVTGRRQATLLYGTDKRHDEVRGKPLLAILLQSLKEIDRYRDSALRKAVINSLLAMFIKKTEDKPGTLPLSGGGALRRGAETALDSDGTERSFQIGEMIPGLIIEELQHGEEPVGFQPHGTDEKFAEFEEAIIQAVAWANEVPPEILRLSFSSNYSASQAAINEFKIYLNKVRSVFGWSFLQPIYIEWLVSQVLAQKIEADGFLDAWRDPLGYETFGAWIAADWTGHIKPAVDITKLVKGYQILIEEGLITRDRAARELTGTKYSSNVSKLARENVALAEANEPLVTLEKPAPPPPPPADESSGDEDDQDINEEDDAEEREGQAA